MIRDVERLLSHRPNYTPADVVMLARAIQGEVAYLFGEQRDEVALWIAHTAINRAQKPWWNRGIAKETEIAFHGVDNVESCHLEPWAIGIALAALMREEDVACGAVFMLSGKDLKQQGLEHRKPEAVQVFEHEGNDFYFFRDNPWRKR